MMSTPGSNSGYSRVSDDGIIHGERKNGNAGCCACTICCVLITCCIVCLILGILVGVGIYLIIHYLLTDRIAFDHFTAEMYYDYGKGHGLYVLQTTFDKRIYSQQLLYNGEAFSNTFTDDYDNYTITCARVGDHDGCYKMTDGSLGSFHVSYLYLLEDENIDCPDVPDPVIPGHKKRKLNKCNHYYINAIIVKQHIWTEVDTDYPVRIRSLTYDEDGTMENNITVDFPYFDPDRPTNKSCITKPNATIWDFRDGEKDDLDVPSYISTLLGPSVARWFKTKMMINKYMKKSNENDNSPAAEFVRKAELAQLHRTMLPIPISTMASVGVGATPLSVKRRDENALEIPLEFDAREEFPSCYPVISNISNQGQCGSCWAMATAAAFSDRACIQNISTDIFSPQYMVDCYLNEMGCNGGFVSTVYSEMKNYGIVSEECIPFKAKDNSCPKTCADGTPITEDMKLKPSTFFSPWDDTDEGRVEAIQREIMTNGPVATSFLVFSGFKKLSVNTTYTRKSSEKFLGGHMVRIIGWGVDGSEDYWLVANSWGTSWGDNGCFRIRRGKNECNIENNVVACLFN